MIRAEFSEAFKKVDVIISPTTPTLPFKIGENINDPLKIYLSDYFTVGNCVTGLPAISIPAGFSKLDLPVGLQIMGPRLSEALLYKVGYAFEQERLLFKKMPSFSVV